ncbi:efflux transporter outer membrane subunit [Thiohalocapsa marina]|nr:TolC family protein [Thiohalocapsa marina]
MVARTAIVALLTLLMLSGCAVKRDHYDTPQVPLPSRYANDAGNTAPDPSPDQREPDAPDLDNWWRLLGSETLNQLVDRALANNADLRIAAQRVMQARARAAQAKGGQYPEVSVPLRYQYEAPDEGIGDVPRGGDVETDETYQIGLRGDWRVDLWGELASLSDSASMELWRAIFEHDDQARRLVAEVVAAYVDYLALNDRMRVARDTEAVLAEMLDGMLTRLDVGDATTIDVEQERSAVYGVRADMPAIALRQAQVANRLAFLVGGVPDGLHLPRDGLNSLRLPRVRAGMPAALLLQRPDVRAIEARLIAADARIDVARARILPPLDLTAEIGYGSTYIEEVFMPHTVFWNFVANLSATVFDAGKRQREVDYSRAVHEEMIETYIKVIYGATVEVEDAFATISHSRERLQLQQVATDAARRAWVDSRDAYLAGAIDYLVWQNTARTYYRYLDDLYSFRGDMYKGQIELFSALGGGAPERAPLPGDGRRPARHLGSILVGEAAPVQVRDHWLPSGGWGTSDTKQQQQGRDQDDDQTQPQWLVALTGSHTRDGVEAMWRDLHNRYPAAVDGHALLAYKPTETVAPEGEDATWYRLTVERFHTRDAAAGWCQSVRLGQTRCDVAEFDPNLTVEGRFPWPDPLEKTLSGTTHGGHPAAPARPTAVRH